MNVRKLLLTLCLLCSSTFAIADPIWIDVRTIEEVTADHIEGDLNMPLAELNVDLLASTYGKDAQIMLYCRSGNRAGQAEALLKTAGFTHIENAGSIGEVRELRHLATQNSSAL